MTPLEALNWVLNEARNSEPYTPGEIATDAQCAAWQDRHEAACEIVEQIIKEMTVQKELIIRWGGIDKVSKRPIKRYRFLTNREAEVFKQGIRAGEGWTDWEELTEDEYRAVIIQPNLQSLFEDCTNHEWSDHDETNWHNMRTSIKEIAEQLGIELEPPENFE